MSQEIIGNVSIDCVIFGIDEGELKTLFIKRNTEPFMGGMSLPGGFVYKDEKLEEAPLRKLHELTGIKDVFLQEVGSFGGINRYPLRRVFTIAYYALVQSADFTLTIGPEAKEVRWIPISEIPELVFDHKEIFDKAVLKLRRHVRTEPVGFNLLPEKFTLTQIQKMYEVILDKKFDKRNFRKKLLKMNLLTDLEEKQTNVSHRAAKLYSFDVERYEELKQKGFTFDL